MAEHRPARSESLQPQTERSSRPDPEPSSVEADVYVWRYALLVVHVRKEEERRAKTGVARRQRGPTSDLASDLANSAHFWNL